MSVVKTSLKKKRRQRWAETFHHNANEDCFSDTSSSDTNYNHVENNCVSISANTTASTSGTFTSCLEDFMPYFPTAIERVDDNNLDFKSVNIPALVPSPESCKFEDTVSVVDIAASISDDNSEEGRANSLRSYNIFSENSSLDSEVSTDVDQSESTVTKFCHFSDGNPIINRAESPSTKCKEFLQQWFIENQPTMSQLSSLARGLKSIHEDCFTNLPIDARTISNTPKSTPSKPVPSISNQDGEYIHIGLIKQLKNVLSKYDVRTTLIKIIINIDGLPLFHSSAGELYPILFKILSVSALENQVFPIGFYYGKSKPSNVEIFLEDFLNEVDLVYRDKIRIKNVTYTVKIIGYCFDAPAKSFILGLNSHNRYYSCTKCKVKGLTVDNRRVFLENDCALRTHQDFVSMNDTNYQIKNTPLMQIQDINFVNSIILDFMHLVLLGIMRTLLFTWNQGKLPFRQSPPNRKRISDSLVGLIPFIPSEFARKPRELNYVLRWKATEFRLFLIYLGPVVLKGVLSKDQYNNFLSLHIAITILLDAAKVANNELRNYARQLLNHFPSEVASVYHPRFITHNFHGVIHLVDELEYFMKLIPNCTLNDLSAFPFEIFLQKCKNLVRGRKKPLQQVARRLREQFSLNSVSQKPIPSSFPHFLSKHKHFRGPLLTFCSNPQYSKVIFKNFIISTTRPDNCVGTSDGLIILDHNICHCTKTKGMVVIGKLFTEKSNLYSAPLCDSSLLGIFRVSKLSNWKYWPLNIVRRKYVCLKYGDNQFAVFPLLHSSV